MSDMNDKMWRLSEPAAVVEPIRETPIDTFLRRVKREGGGSMYLTPDEKFDLRDSITALRSALSAAQRESETVKARMAWLRAQSAVVAASELGSSRTVLRVVAADNSSAAAHIATAGYGWSSEFSGETLDDAIDAAIAGGSTPRTTEP